MIDFNLKNDERVILNNDIDLIFQQIDILFDTTPTNVLGFEEYGTTYDRFLYDLKLSPGEIQSQVYSDINSMELFGFVPYVEVYLLQGSEQDIALIDIELKRDLEYYKKTYKIS